MGRRARAWPNDEKFRRFAAKVADACLLAGAMGAHLGRDAPVTYGRCCPMGAVTLMANLASTEAKARRAGWTAANRMAAIRSNVAVLKMFFDAYPMSDESARAFTRLLGGSIVDWIDQTNAFEKGFDGEPREGFPREYYQLGQAYRLRAEGTVVGPIKDTGVLL
jgi:hypothetical protein